MHEELIYTQDELRGHTCRAMHRLSATDCSYMYDAANRHKHLFTELCGAPLPVIDTLVELPRLHSVRLLQMYREP